MVRISCITKSIAGMFVVFGLAMTASADLTVNGGFETGDTSGWVSFPSANSTFVTTLDSSHGLFAGEVFNDDAGSAAVIKQANLGIGTVLPDELVNISFSAKGMGQLGGIVFAEFFSEIDGGGTSSSGILGGGPLALTNDYQDFNFQVTTGADVSGGITLQFAVVTGATTGSESRLFVDNVSVSRAVPEPGSFAIVALSGIAVLARRKR